MTELRGRRPKGTGRVYTRPDSDYYWIHYSFRGRLHREETHLLIAEKGNERAAQKLLRTRQAEIQLGTFLALGPPRESARALRGSGT